MSVESNRIFSEKDLGLIRGYIQPHKQTRQFSSGPSSSSFPSFTFPFFGGVEIGNDYNNYHYYNDQNHTPPTHGAHLPQATYKQKSKGNKYGDDTWVAVAILATVTIYFVNSLVGLYRTGQSYYYTRKVRQLSDKTSKNPDERAVIKNLKTLLEADRSTQFLRTQNIKAAGAFGIIMASGSYIAATVGDFAGDARKFVLDYFPNFMQPSEPLLNKAIEVLSDSNLKTFAAATAIASVAIVTLNGTYSLYKDFFYDTQHPAMFLRKKANDVEASLNRLENSTTAAFKNSILWTKSYIS